MPFNYSKFSSNNSWDLLYQTSGKIPTFLYFINSFFSFSFSLFKFLFHRLNTFYNAFKAGLSLCYNMKFSWLSILSLDFELSVNYSFEILNDIIFKDLLLSFLLFLIDLIFDLIIDSLKPIFFGLLPGESLLFYFIEVLIFEPKRCRTFYSSLLNKKGGGSYDTILLSFKSNEQLGGLWDSKVLVLGFSYQFEYLIYKS